MSETWLGEEHSGIGRLNYFLGKLGIMVGMIVAIKLLGPGSSWLKIIGLVMSYVSFALDVARLRNIGLSRWWSVLRFVPYVSLLYLIFLQSAPAGWNETRRMDRTGKILFIIQLALVALMIFMLMRMGIAIPYFI